MNKKVLTLCAGFLLAGSLATVEAEIKTVTPEISGSYLLGTNVNVTTDQMQWLNNGINATATQVDVTEFSAKDWTLEQAKDADDELIEEQFYLKAPNGRYLGSLNKNGASKLVADVEDAVIFKLSGVYTVVESDPAGFWSKGWYMSIQANGAKQQIQAGTVRPNVTTQALKYVTLSAASNFSGNQLIETIDSNEYYFIGTNTTSAGDKVLMYDKNTGSISLEQYPAASDKYGDAYDAYLWKVSATTANNIITYTFESKIDGAKFTFTTDYAYANGFNLTGAPFAANQIVALYKSPVIYKTAAELNAILTNGFEMTIKKNKDDNSVISGIDAFSGKLTAIGNENDIRFRIAKVDRNGDPEEFLVLNTKATWGTGNVGALSRGNKFEWVDAEDVDKSDYRSYFQFTYYAGAADVKLMVTCLSKMVQMMQAG